VFPVQPLPPEDIEKLVRRAMTDKQRGLQLEPALDRWAIAHLAT